MKFKKSLIFICLILCLLSIASVCASEVNDTIVASEDQNDKIISIENQDNDKLSATENDELLAEPAGTFTDLNEKITTSGNVITLDKNYTYSADADSNYIDGIIINRPITIDGNGYTINGNDQARAFKITATDVILKNITFINCKYFTGGAIYWTGNDGAVENCNFINNTATDNDAINSGGGAIQWHGSNGNITNCNFTNNTAISYGGAVNVNYIGELKGNVKISNSNFVNNSAVKAGGAIYTESGNNTVLNCVFINNKATSYRSLGGAIYLPQGDETNISKSIFINNTADYGGAIYIGTNQNITNIEYCDFTNNSAKVEDGGAINGNGDNSAVKNCTFTNNTAKDDGGAIYWNGDNSAVKNCTFTNNTAGYYGGAINWNSKKGTVENCTLTNNTAVIGGAIYWTGADGAVKNCTLTNNKANNGGAIYWTGADGAVKNCTLTNNTAVIGGAIYWYQTVKGAVENCTLTNNNAKMDGGAIYWHSDNGAVKNCTLTNNNAEYGGAIYWAGETGVLDKCTFTNNTASSGGAIVTDKKLNVKNSYFIDNKANNDDLTSTNKTKLILTFTGNENYINAIFASEDVTFENVTYWNGNIVNSNGATPKKSIYEEGINITIEIYNSENALVDNVTYVTDSFGKVTYDYSNLPRGNYTYKAYHTDDNYYTYIETEGEFKLNKFNVIVLNNTTVTLEYPGNIILNATLTDHYNNTISAENIKLIFILSNGTEIEATNYNNGIFSVNYTFGSTGEYSVSAKINVTKIIIGDDEYLPGNIYNATVNITKITNYNINITDIKPGRAGDNTTITVQVPKDITGNVKIIINGTEYPVIIENGIGIVNVTLNKSGNYTAIAKLTDDVKYLDKESDPKTFEVTKVDDYSIDISVVPGVEGKETVINVTVPDDVTGNVIVTVNGTNYTAVKVNTTYQVKTTLNPGKYVANATVSNDPKYTDKTSENNSFEVHKINSYDITVDIAPGDEGKDTVINVTVPDDVTGNVIVTVNGTNYTAVKVNTTYQVKTTLNPGKYVANATVSNDPKYTDKTSEDNSFDVPKVNSYDMPVDVVSGNRNTNTTVTVKLPEDATGNVTVTLSNGTSYTGPVENGTATISIPVLPVGDYPIKVTYSGDSKYVGKTNSTTISIKEIIVAEDMKRGWDSPYDYQAKLVDQNGNPIAGANITFTVNGKKYSTTTDSNGIAQLTTSKLDVGKYSVTTTNPTTGENVTKELTIVARIIENKDITKDYESTTQFKVRAIGDDGNPVGANEIVTIKINGKTYSVKTDKNGYATLPIHLKPKSYTATSTYHKYTVKNKVTVKQTLKLVKKTVKVKKGKSLVLKATLKWTNGKAIVGKKITFKFKGKKYVVKTNKKGIAKLTIKKSVTKKLKAGKTYKYSAKYIKETATGKVKVKK